MHNLRRNLQSFTATANFAGGTGAVFAKLARTGSQIAFVALEDLSVVWLLMASVELFLDKPDEVPDVCLCCGEATKQVYPTRLITCWGKMVTLQAPLCPLHKNHFNWRLLVFALMVASIIVLLTWLAVLVNNLEIFSSMMESPFLLAAFGLGGLWFLGLGMVLVYLRAGGVRLGGMKSGKMMLLNVAPEYAEALRVFRQVAAREKAPETSRPDALSEGPLWQR